MTSKSSKRTEKRNVMEEVQREIKEITIVVARSFKDCNCQIKKYEIQNKLRQTPKQESEKTNRVR